MLVYSSEDVSVAPILLTVAEMGLMKGEGEDLVERLSGVSPPVPAEAEPDVAEVPLQPAGVGGGTLEGEEEDSEAWPSHCSAAPLAGRLELVAAQSVGG